jgi:hypothetical protein
MISLLKKSALKPDILQILVIDGKAIMDNQQAPAIA